MYDIHIYIYTHQHISVYICFHITYMILDSQLYHNNTRDTIYVTSVSVVIVRAAVPSFMNVPKDFPQTHEPQMFSHIAYSVNHTSLFYLFCREWL